MSSTIHAFCNFSVLLALTTALCAQTPQLSPSKVEGLGANATVSGASQTTTGKASEGPQSGKIEQSILTTAQGIPIGDNQNSLKLGPNGPTLLEDFQLREKIFHFDHERIPERVVHARGFGAHGYFENYESLASITKADIFQRAEEKTPTFVRFSTVEGSAGSPDLARDVRGFAVKFYTQQGNWDIVRNNIPIFLYKTQSSFRILSTLPSLNQIADFLKCKPLTTIFGILFR